MVERVFILTNIVSPVGAGTESLAAEWKLTHGNRVRWQPGQIWSGRKHGKRIVCTQMDVTREHSNRMMRRHQTENLLRDNRNYHQGEEIPPDSAKLLATYI